MNERGAVRIAILGMLLAGLLVAVRIAANVQRGGWAAASGMNLAICIGLGGLLAIAAAYGIWAFARVRAATANVPGWAIFIWLIVVLVGIAAVPAATRVNQYSLASLFVFGALAALPALLVDMGTLRLPTPRAEWTGRVIVHMLLLAAWLAATMYMAAAWRQIGSVDFFYYICAARDMVAPNVSVSDRCYSYFPGVYAFWRAVMKAVGTQLPQLQLSFLWVLIANALLVGLIARSLTHRWLAGGFAALWYLVLASRFEGLAGVSEPLATSVLLAGCLVWGGRPLRERRGYLLAAVLGVAFGLTVYMKQQAGLLTLAATALLVVRPAMSDDKRHGWGQLALLPLAAFVTVVAGIWLEGKGWVPVQEGLAFASDYGTENSFWRNLYVQIRSDESAALAAGLLGLAWCVIFFRTPLRRRWVDSPQFQMVTFALFAFLFTLIQFISRPFGHYMLLGLPWLVVACVAMGYSMWSSLPTSIAQSALVRTLVLIALAVPLFNTWGRTDTLYVWRWQLPEDFRANELWHEQPARENDLAIARMVVVPGSSMYILPPRRNSIYYLLDTHTASPGGYTFFETDWDRFPWSDCRYFILLTSGLNEFDYQFSSPQRLEEMRQLLVKQGFRQRDDLGLKTMELFVQDE